MHTALKTRNNIFYENEYNGCYSDSCPSFIILEILEDNIRAFVYQYREGKLKISKEILTDVHEQSE